MTRSEFEELIATSGDIMLDVRERHYTILCWGEEGIGIDRQHPYCQGLQYFQTAQELLEKYQVSGIPLGDLSEEVKITCCN